MARNIVEHAQLWPITYQGEVFTDHPPLFLWLTALSYKIFGISDFAANFVPRLFAVLTVIVTGMIAMECGLGVGVALASAIILCLTRDFVLSSVRGYIEPVLEFFIYLGLLFAIRQKNVRTPWPAAIAGISVWLAAFSKGPVAFWPLLICLFLLVWNKRRLVNVAAYMAAFAVCTAIWAVWVTLRGDWHYWNSYVVGQVISSALDGRGGAQSLEPFYFLQLLAKYYWPWLPLLLFAIYRTVRTLLTADSSIRATSSILFMLTGLGFVGGFSLMRWKFWYYIAPAYPAFALLIATSLRETWTAWMARPLFAQRLALIAGAWIALMSVFPITLHHERVPEVLAFKDTIVNSDIPGPVWFVRNPRDHNMIGTSGGWYFNRVVEKVSEDDEATWARTKLKNPAWIITGADFWPTCKRDWCTKSAHIQSAGKSTLVYYNGK